jgi:hypothetical protein
MPMHMPMSMPLPPQMRGATRLLTVVVVATALTVAATTAHAQAAGAAPTGTTPTGGVTECGPGTAYPRCEDVPRPPSLLYAGLEVTEAQQAASDAISSSYRALYRELGAERQAGRMTLPVYQAQFKSLRARERAEKRKLMTPEQHARFDVNVDSLRKSDDHLMGEAAKRAEDREKQRAGTPRS